MPQTNVEITTQTNIWTSETHNINREAQKGHNEGKSPCSQIWKARAFCIVISYFLLTNGNVRYSNSVIATSFQNVYSAGSVILF